MLHIPTTKEIREQLLADIQSQLGGNIPVWRKAFNKALATALAPLFKVAYLYGASVQKNVFPDLADSESVGGTLERFGRAKLGRGPLQATQGKYLITVTGTIGAVLPVNTTFKSTDASSNPDVMYVLDAAVTLSATAQQIEVRALVAGTQGRQSTGDEMIVTAPILGVNNSAVVFAESLVPNAGETIEEYRSVVLSSYRLMPQGGSAADYILWAQDASGVLHAYPYSANGAPGEVEVFIESTKEDSVDGRGTPTATTLNNAEAVILADPITGRGRLPLGVAALTVSPVAIVEVVIDVPGFVGLTLLKQQAINAALEELINDVRPFIAGGGVVADKNDTLSVNLIVAKILEVMPGSAFAAPILKVTRPGVAQEVVTAIVFDYGNIPYLTNVNYV